MRLLTTVGIMLLAFFAVGVILARRDRLPPSAQLGPASREGLKGSLAIASDGTFIKASSSGLFRSADAGQTWAAIRFPPRLAPSGIGHVVVNPESPSVIYAAGIDAGVIVSEDGGATWRRVITGLPSLDVEAMAMHAFRRETLFISVRGGGVYRTENGAGQWERMDGGPSGKPVLALAHSPLKGSMNTGWLYAGTADGPYLSMDCF